MKRSDITDQDALDACWAYGNPDDRGGPFTVLARYPRKVIQRKLEQLEDRGLIDYGTTIVYSWRTPEGEAALDQLHAELTPSDR